jgi:hypothetical protein
VTESIPADIRQFVLRYIDSISEMEALVMLAKSPDTWWTVEEVATRLYVSSEDAGAVMGRLAGHGIAKLGADGRHRYARLHEDDAATVERLTQMYATQLIPITNLIHSKRGSRIQEFADAFRLRSKD